MSFVCYQSCAHDILKTNEPTSMSNDTSGPRGNGMKRSTLGVGRSKFNVTHKAEDRFAGLAGALETDGYGGKNSRRGDETRIRPGVRLVYRPYALHYRRPLRLSQVAYVGLIRYAKLFVSFVT